MPDSFYVTLIVTPIIQFTLRREGGAHHFALIVQSEALPFHSNAILFVPQLFTGHATRCWRGNKQSHNGRYGLLHNNNDRRNKVISIKKCLTLTFAFLSTLIVLESNAATLTDDFTTGPSSVWTKATWTNGSPFGCAFSSSSSYIYPASSGMVFKNDTNYCGEMYTANNYTYGTLDTVMSISNTKGTVGSAFMISGGPGSSANWEEMDVEILPSFVGRVHFAVIFQAYSTSSSGTAWGGSNEYIYDTYAVNPVPIGTGGAYKIIWSTTSLKFYAGGQLLWTVVKGPTAGYSQCAQRVGGTTASANCYIPAAQWPVSNKSIRLNSWSGDGSAWPGAYDNASVGYAWYDYVYYK